MGKQMVANDKQNTEKPNKTFKTTKLTRKDVDFIISQLGPHEKLTVDEVRKLTAEKLKGSSLTEEILRMRDQGY